MPEAAEVHLIARELHQRLAGQRVVLVDVTAFEGVRFFKGLAEALAQVAFPLTVDSVAAKGKQLYLHCHDASDRPWFVLHHLGMTGYWSLQPEPHDHLRLSLEDGTTLYYCDSRKFGNFQLLSDRAAFDRELASLAPSLLDPAATYEEFEQRLRKHSGKYLLPCLLDQRCLLSGVGNYLASEGLYAASLHPEVRCGQLSSLQAQALWDGLRSLATRAVAAGGMTMRDYRHLDGSKGSFAEQLQVYGRVTTPEGQAVRKDTGKHGRSVYWDPVRQPVAA